MHKTERRISRYENDPQAPHRFTAEREEGGDLLAVQFQTVETGGGFSMTGPDLAAFVEFLGFVVADAAPWQNEGDVEDEPPAPDEEEPANG